MFINQELTFQAFINHFLKEKFHNVEYIIFNYLGVTFARLKFVIDEDLKNLH